MSLEVTRKSFPVICLLCGLCFLAGWFLGRSRGLPTKVQTLAREHPKSEALPSIDQKNGELASDTAVLEYLDWSRLDDAKQFLRLRQDGEILFINELRESADERARGTTARLLARIAKHRAENPFSYKGELPTGDTNATSEVAAILRRFR